MSTQIYVYIHISKYLCTIMRLSRSCHIFVYIMHYTDKSFGSGTKVKVNPSRSLPIWKEKHADGYLWSYGGTRDILI